MDPGHGSRSGGNRGFRGRSDLGGDGGTPWIGLNAGESLAVVGERAVDSF